jgi:hypothetical protein
VVPLCLPALSAPDQRANTNPVISDDKNSAWTLVSRPASKAPGSTASAFAIVSKKRDQQTHEPSGFFTYKHERPPRIPKQAPTKKAKVSLKKRIVAKKSVQAPVATCNVEDMPLKDIIKIVNEYLNKNPLHTDSSKPAAKINKTQINDSGEIPTGRKLPKPTLAIKAAAYALDTIIPYRHQDPNITNLLAKNALILISEHIYDGYRFNFTSRHNAERLRIHLEDFSGKYSSS